MFIVIILETKHSCFQIIIHLHRYRLECKKTNFFKNHVLEMNSMKPYHSYLNTNEYKRTTLYFIIVLFVQTLYVVVCCPTTTQ